MKSSGTTNNKILDLQKKMFTEQAPEAYMNSKKKANFDDIAHLYKEKESEEAYKCIQKYDMLKNPQVRAELIKRAYAVTMNLENFLEYLRFLLSVDESWKESIEEKSINIATQMIKMQNKEKINTKEIIPVEFFTTVVKLSLKDYYSHAFEIFKPSIKKIFEKDLMAVHAVGILFRYTLGS
jgi:3-isopropylmalate dehydratase small subunit